MVLKLFVHAEGGSAHGAFVREMRRFESQLVVSRHVTEQFPLVYLELVNKEIVIGRLNGLYCKSSNELNFEIVVCISLF